jgi:hypothetical protein
MEFFYKELSVNVSAPMTSVSYNSANPAENTSNENMPFEQLFGALIGKPMNVVFNADGTVKSVSGFDAIVEGIRTSMSANPVMQEAGNNMLQSFNEDAIKQMLEQSFNMYPQEEINIGESWSSELLSDMSGMASSTKSTYTLVSVENNIAFFDVVAAFAVTPNAPMEGEMTGEFTGEMSIDVNTGMVIHSNLKGDAAGKFLMQGMEFLTNVESEATITLER